MVSFEQPTVLNVFLDLKKMTGASTTLPTVHREFHQDSTTGSVISSVNIILVIQEFGGMFVSNNK